MIQPLISDLSQLKTTAISDGGLQLGQNPSLLLTSQSQPTLTTGLQLGQQQTLTGTQGLGLHLSNQSKAPTSSLTSLTMNTSLLSQPVNTTTATTSVIGGIGLQTISKPPPAYTTPSTTASIQATSTAGGAPTGKKYTYKQLEKMINEVSVECLYACVCMCVYSAPDCLSLDLEKRGPGLVLNTHICLRTSPMVRYCFTVTCML